MKTLTFDALTRRASIVPLGAAGLAAMAGFAPSQPAAAKKKSAKKQARKKCQQQVEQCTTTLTTICESDPQCLDNAANIQPCCSFLGNCDVLSFLLCAS